MKLIYGRGLLVDLDCTDPADYGFDTFQLKNMYSNSQLGDIVNALSPVDQHFDPEVDFVLSITLKGDYRCGSNSASGSRGSIDRDPWYDNPNHAFYNGWHALFEDAQERYGSRFKGIRWNHEYPPRLFKEGSKWQAYAEEHAAADYEDVQNNHLSEWHRYLNNVARTNARDAYLRQGAADQDPYNTAAYASVRPLYRHFVHFQCKAQARMVKLLASELPSGKTLIIYPAQQTGHVHTAAEYTLNTDQVTAANAVREITTWDTHDYDNARRNAMAAAQGSRKYLFVIQQGRRDLPSPPEDRIGARTQRIQGNIENCLDPGQGQDPWNNSFAFWNRWRENDPSIPEPERITRQEQEAYMDEVADALN